MDSCGDNVPEHVAKINKSVSMKQPHWDHDGYMFDETRPNQPQDDEESRFEEGPINKSEESRFEQCSNNVESVDITIEKSCSDLSTVPSFVHIM